MNVGLFFGSFNPFHLGHKVISSHLIEFTDLEKIMFVVSPQNPLKNKNSLLDQNHRLQIITSEIEDTPEFMVSNIEFDMPIPSYTIDTLVRIKERYKKDTFSLIMGADNIANFHKWKNYKNIIDNHMIYVYPRNNINVEFKHENVINVQGVPNLEISASFIRKSIKCGKNVAYLMPEKVWKYIDEMNFYKK